MIWLIHKLLKVAQCSISLAYRLSSTRSARDIQASGIGTEIARTFLALHILRSSNLDQPHLRETPEYDDFIMLNAWYYTADGKSYGTCFSHSNCTSYDNNIHHFMTWAIQQMPINLDRNINKQSDLVKDKVMHG